MRKAPVLFFLLLAAAHSTPARAADPTERLSAVEENQRVLELRLTRVEERLSQVEDTSANMRHTPSPAVRQAQTVSGNAPPQLTVQSKAQESPVVRYVRAENNPESPSARPSPGSAAHSRKTGEVLLDIPLPVSPYLTLAKARGSDRLAASPSRSLEYTGAPVAPPPAAPTVRGPKPASAPEAQAAPGHKTAGKPVTSKSTYDVALGLYHKGDYAKAQQTFKSFLQSSPSSALTPNAMYWEGECLYSMGKYDEAIIIFKDVASKYPKHDKAAASLLKAGYAYERIKDMENAKFYWQILLDDFPGSAPANLARKRLGAG